MKPKELRGMSLQVKLCFVDRERYVFISNVYQILSITPYPSRAMHASYAIPALEKSTKQKLKS